MSGLGHHPSTHSARSMSGGKPYPSMIHGLCTQILPDVPAGCGECGSSPMRTLTPGSAWPAVSERTPEAGARSAVTVNVSGRQIQSPQFISDVRTALTRLVHEYGALNRQLHYHNRFGKRLTVPVSW